MDEPIEWADIYKNNACGDFHAGLKTNCLRVQGHHGPHAEGDHRWEPIVARVVSVAETSQGVEIQAEPTSSANRELMLRWGWRR